MLNKAGSEAGKCWVRGVEQCGGEKGLLAGAAAVSVRGQQSGCGNTAALLRTTQQSGETID